MVTVESLLRDLPEIGTQLICRLHGSLITVRRTRSGVMWTISNREVDEQSVRHALEDLQGLRAATAPR